SFELRSGGATLRGGSSSSAWVASRLRLSRVTAKTISPITTMMPRRARWIAGPGCAASSVLAVTGASFRCVGSCAVAAEGCEPAGGGGGGGVGEEQGGGETDREFVFVAGERKAGAAGHQLGCDRDESFGDAFD